MRRPFRQSPQSANLSGMTRAVPALFLFLAACSDFPQLGHPDAALVGPNTTPPLLTEAELTAIGATAPDRSNALSAEAAALRTRAENLRAR